MSVLISSVIFTVFHCLRYNTIYQLTLVFIQSIILGYIYIKTKSLYISIGMHFSIDFFANIFAVKGEIGLFILDINTKFSEVYLEESLFKLMTAFGLIIFFILLFKGKLFFGKNR